METKPRVLVLDDDAALRRMITRMLRRRFEVADVADADEALALVRGGQRFDMILVDLCLDGMSGRTFCTRLREIAPDQAIRAVIHTGSAPREEGERFLRKPAPAFAYDAVFDAIVGNYGRVS
jgi:CheY-like chemotaxis protein